MIYTIIVRKSAQGAARGLPKQMGEFDYAAPQHLNYHTHRNTL